MLSKYSYKKLGKQMKILGFTTYKEFLLSDLWRVFKIQIRKVYDISRCFKCGSGEKVSLHHISYKNLLNPSNIAVLCSKCHLNQHKEKSINMGIGAQYLLGSKNHKIAKLYNSKSR